MCERDFTWLNYENGPFDGSQPHFHGSAIAMSSQVQMYLLTSVTNGYITM